MIEQLTDVPEHVAGFRATGKVQKDDYEKIVIPVVDRIAERFGKINFILVLETSVGNYSLGAWIDDALIGLKHFTQWRKIAIVSNQASVRKATDLLGHLAPGEYKGFDVTEREAALNWVSE